MGVVVRCAPGLHYTVHPHYGQTLYLQIRVFTEGIFNSQIITHGPSGHLQMSLCGAERLPDLHLPSQG